MVVYNVTVKVQQVIADSWLSWMKEEHIPDIIATGCFTSARILRLLEVDDAEGPTYAVQYNGAGTEEYNKYIAVFADEMRKRATDKWGNNFIAFRTVMQIVY